jgi:hypothetical protein
MMKVRQGLVFRSSDAIDEHCRFFFLALNENELICYFR